MTPKEKREQYFKQNPEVYNLYSEIKQFNASNVSNDEKLRNIKQYAIGHTEFYKDYKVDDVFPVMNKQRFIKNYDSILSNEKFERPFHITSTTGSTGTPFKIVQNYEKRLRTIADLKVYGDYALYPSHEKMLQLRAYCGRELDRSIDERENIWRCDILDLSDSAIENIINYILSNKTNTVFGYVSTLETISNYVIRKGYDYDFGVKSVLVGAEALTDDIAEKIKKVFKCPVFDRYSNMEMGIYAQREFGKTNFKLNKASYYFEVLKLDSDEPAEEHEFGRIVITDLYNFAFPMIRYDTGDIGSFCINNGEMEIEQVLGRRVDAIYLPDGSLLNPHILSNSLWGVEGITQWQFIQKTESSYLFKINKNGFVDEQDIINRLSKVFGSDAEISFEYVDEIPVLNSQKRKYIINEWKK